MLIEVLAQTRKTHPSHPLVNQPLTESFMTFLAEFAENNPAFPPPGYSPDMEFLDDVWELWLKYVFLRIHNDPPTLFRLKVRRRPCPS